jgi:hypothetical protein
MRSVVAPEPLTKGTMIARDRPARVMGSVFVNASLAECQVAQLLQSGNPRELLAARRALTKPPKPPKGGFGGFGGLCARYILTNFDPLDADVCIHSQGSSITKCVFVFLERTVYTVWLTASPLLSAIRAMLARLPAEYKEVARSNIGALAHVFPVMGRFADGPR